MKINLNDKVKVKLSERGFKIHKDKWNLLFSNYGYTYNAPNVDADGYSEFQLWELMHEFGSHLYHGCAAMPFENTELSIEKVV